MQFIKIKNLLSFIVLLFSVTCNAQPIQFIVSASIGGPADQTTRKVIEKIETSSNLELVPLNKPGAAHTIAYNYILNSTKPTLILSTPEISNHEVFRNVDDIYTMGYFNSTVFVSKKSGINDITQLMQLSKTREINFGHGGVGSNSYAAMLSLCESTLRCLDVPYKSGNEGMLAVLTGEIDAYALVSYGVSFSKNDKHVAIYDIKSPREKSWLKLFAKNIPKKDIDTIVNILESQNVKFFNDMGLKK